MRAYPLWLKTQLALGVLIAVACWVLIGCKGEIGPMGPAGPQGETGPPGGIEFHVRKGVIGESGQAEVALPYLNMGCPPLISVYYELSPGDWIMAVVLDNFETNEIDYYYLEFVHIQREKLILYSSTAATQHVVPYYVSIVCPQGYFAEEYRCP